MIVSIRWSKLSLKMSFDLLILISILVLLNNHVVQQATGSGSQMQISARPMRILALFSGTKNELGLDHRLGRQILRSAIARAKQLHPDLGEVELLIHNDDTECTSLNEIPNRVADIFYGKDKECSQSSSSKCSDMMIHQQDDQSHLYTNNTQQQQQVFQQASIDAIIGPSCDHLVDLVARMAAYWRTPIYSVASVGAAFSRKEIYSTLTRLSPSIDQLSTFVIKTMERYKWRHLAIIMDRRHVENRILLENLDRTINQLKFMIPIDRKLIDLKVTTTSVSEQTSSNINSLDSQQSGSLCSPEARSTLLEARRVARVFLFLVSDHQLIRKLLLCAHELQMSNGDFVFLAIDMGLKSAEASPVATGTGNDQSTFTNQNDGGESGLDNKQQSTSSRVFMNSRTAQTLDWYSANDERNNLIAKKVFQSLMVFSVELPIGDEFSLFVEQTLDMVQQEFPTVRFERSSVGPLAVALHDSLLLAVEAHTRQKQQQNATNRSGSVQLAEEDEFEHWRPSLEAPLMWNERYSGGLIANMHINSNGDQELDYVLSDLEPEMGLMRPVARYAKESRQIENLPGTYVHWPARAGALSGERAPPDEPECGFNDDAERCIDRQNLYAALSIVLALAVLVLASAFVSLRKYRNIKYQMQLDDYWWKINWQELQFIQATESLASSNPQSVARALRSGASVVSSHTGSGSVISVSAPQTKQKTPKAGVGSKQTAASGEPTSEHQQVGLLSSKKRRPAVPTIVTSGTIDSADKNSLPGANKSVVGSETGSQHHGGGMTTGSQLGSGLTPGNSVINIKSEYSSVVRASNLAMYKNELVIVKQLNGSSIEVSRELLVDLRSMREHIHDNLARFVGLSSEPERLAIVYEYCSRGSLQDMLLNESIAIDWTLKCSIIGDILNGLSFIHTTLLNYHGRLKSTNLVLDSRFTVKITDFGLQNLYSQLEAIKEKDDNDDDDDSMDYGDDNEQHDAIQRDTLSLSVSQRAIGGPNPSQRSTSGRGKTKSGAKRLQLKNRGSARYFWTAPEHLRAKEVHCAGSKKGDVYSLAVILFELLTRREPYHYGTNAKPHWSTIKRERKALIAQQPPATTGGGGQQLTSGSGVGGQRNSMVSTTVTSSIGRRAQAKLRRLGGGSSQVGPTPELATADSVSIASHHDSVHSFGSVQSQVPAGDHQQVHQQVNKQHQPVGLSAVSAIDENEEGATASTSQVHNATSGSEQEPIDAEEILDHLRMGLQPEPVRPHLPNFVLHELNPKLVELMRDCWSELPEARPTLAQIRQQMRKITKGMASKNYLDNLLDRLQNYAADLERIVDAKSSDIVEEKFRTEELLYQLLPKFVADCLKRNEPIIPQVFDGVTIFFSDIVGFEKYASVMSPNDLVDLLNSIYCSFESVITSFDVTKIETIIDQFLVASGISLEQHNQQQQQLQQQRQQEISGDKEQTGVGSNENNQQQQQQTVASAIKSKRAKLLGSLRHSRGSSDKNQSLDLNNSSQEQENQQVGTGGGNTGGGVKVDQMSDYYRRSSAEQIARMALCLRDQMKSFHFRSAGEVEIDEQPLVGGGSKMATNFNIRIGIHSGKVCAGIVGVKRPKFCLIGDTVNVASRMHTNSKANKIQISANTKELLGQIAGFTIEPRGKIEVKGKGMMETFWLESSF